MTKCEACSGAQVNDATARVRVKGTLDPDTGTDTEPHVLYLCDPCLKILPWQMRISVTRLSQLALVKPRAQQGRRRRTPGPQMVGRRRGPDFQRTRSSQHVPEPSFTEREEAESKRIDGDRLKAWLLNHPEAWHGWPTYAAFTDPKEVIARQARLIRAKCPFAKNGYIVNVVDNLIAEIRKARRKLYNAKVALEMGRV